MKNTSLLKSALLAAIGGSVALSANAQVIFSDNFQSYADDAAAQQVWVPVGTNATAGLTLTTDGSNTFASISRQANNNVFTWAGNSDPNLVPEEFRTETGWSYTPTDERPLVFTVSIYDPGTGGLAINTAGIRTGTSPLFEMGLYNGDFGSYVVRTVGMHTPEGYRYFQPGTGSENIRTEGWHLFQATFTSTTTTVTLDLGSDGTVDHTLVYSGSPIGPFSDLRIGGPAGAATGGSAIGYDNIRLEVIPEPSTYAAIFGGLALLGAFVYRRRTRAEK